ncbi:YhdP family protein [Azonexus sp.]|uniref:YhdP family protein n=1 Tax=Azonexus sp. TaxID=1872668 RepID=UPI0027B99017|nr:YhdP family protein [Azonexus sp.]
MSNSSGPHLPEVSPAVHRVLYYRLHGLRALLARPFVAAALRLLGWGLLAGWLLFVVLVLVLRFAILPSITDYRDEIERAATQAVGQQVKIGRIAAYWRGLNPELVLDDVALLDQNGEPAFSLNRVDSVLSWQSLWRLRPMLALLAFEQPVLHIRRDVDGRIRIAGLNSEGDSDPAMLEWLLEQKSIRIHDATIVWEDAMRQAPPLILEDLQFGLDNRGRRHRFGFSAAPPEALAARVDVRGEVLGDVHDALESFAGQLFVELAYADLAGWKPWVDYPMDLPQGRGALRIWGDLAAGAGRLTADLALSELHIRLGESLPLLELTDLRGRLKAEYKALAWALAGQQLELQTADGVRLPPTDFRLDWRQANAAGAATIPAVNGNASANLLDLDVLSQLATYLPLDARSRQLLLAHAPQGKISELRTSWGLQGDQLTRYALAARFADLGVRAASYVPGASGLSGSIDLNEKRGLLLLEAGQSGLSLPAVFPEPDMAFDSLKARVSWVNAPEALDIQIERLAFSGPDATGDAQGTYRYSGDGPGEIDLQANIEKANGSAVWRYMPHAVNSDARTWLRHGIVAGTAHQGKLVLKGNLKDFPFRDPSTGKFLVTGKARDAKVHYADGWPDIDAISADMSFDYGMRIKAHAGNILGAGISAVAVEIPDFDVPDEMLLVRGAAQGPTSEFLDFIERSPVAETIDRFTEGMKAQGNGRLDLELDIPLRRPHQTRVRGKYHFHDNQVHLVDGLPMITQVNGNLELSEKSVAAKEITGRGFGGPLKVQIGSNAGKVAVVASGTANIAEVSRHFEWPLINHLTGSTPWKAEIGIRKRSADVLVTSDLVGISSPLPDLLNKTATSRLPLRVERTAPSAADERYRITLGNVARGIVVRRAGKWAQGAIALGDSELTLPERGLAVRIALPEINADAWRNYLPAQGAASDGAADDGLALTQVSLKTPALRLLGRDYAQVNLSLKPQDNGWLIGLDTREVAGDLLWRGAGDGWIEGRLRRLHLSSATAGGDTASATDSLPGMSLQVDDLWLDKKALGHLELRARNQRGSWQLEKLRLRNPDGELVGSGRWTQEGRQRTDLEFVLTTNDIGKLLMRLGYEDAVRQGKASLSGDLRWNGALTALDYASLAGDLQVKAEKGQFNKLEPGVGRLLGLISLQSLPRRLTLDFRDLFSDGLAFDSIDGKLAVEAGVMKTQGSLKISGPAVQVVIDGKTDLQQETQDLQVLVRPEVGGLAAVGAAALVNPAVGAAALVANTILQNPLNRLFSYRYHVTGTWDDPQVRKAGQIEEILPAASEEEKR